MFSRYYKETHNQLSRAKQTGRVLLESTTNIKVLNSNQKEIQRKYIKTKSFDSYRMTRTVTEAIMNHRKKITVEMISKYFHKEKLTPIFILYLFI